MNQKPSILAVTLAAITIAFTTQLNAATTFTFQENGSNINLGPTSTFTLDGISLTASGFLTAGGTANLFAKSQGAGEIGLGIFGSLDNEITTSNFIQLTLPTTPPTPLQLILGGSVSGGEQLNVLFNTVPGTLAGATLIGSITATGGTVTIPDANQIGFIDITSGNNLGNGNVLLASATVVPEPGTVALLSIGLAGAGIAGLRRTLRARRTSK
jgi:PEP-CTERM motif